jgi:hypothetical protein
MRLKRVTGKGKKYVSVNWISKGKGTVKFAPEQAVKAHRGSRDIALLVL